MDEIFSVFKEYLPLITADGMVVSAVSLVSRIGPGRAVWIVCSFSFHEFGIRFESETRTRKQFFGKVVYNTD
jgi:hypothetical protein